METTLSRLSAVFRDVFNDDTIVLTPDTSADDIDEWDSLMHVTLLVNIEQAFAIKFSTVHAALGKDVAELVELIETLTRALAHAQCAPSPP